MPCLYLPLEGELEITGADGPSLRIRRGDALGLTSLLVPRRLTAQVSARSQVKLLEIDGGAFLSIARRRPWMGVRVFSGLAQELATELSDSGEGLTHKGRRWWNPATWHERRSD